ncbi:MAG: transcriptional regulator, CdaR family, partial [Ilumatobacteraceae bacterium]|nr:transcriptional regulator, CdaR family [Ilumatobacteraceae bacterium]
ADDRWAREQLSSLRGLLALSTMMAGDVGEERILELATGAVPSIGRCMVVAVALGGLFKTPAGMPAPGDDLIADLSTLPRDGGAVTVAGQHWASAVPMASRGLDGGWLVVGAAVEPSPNEQYLVRLLAQQTSVALADARVHANEREVSAELLTANELLRRSMEIHDRLTAVALAGEGVDGIARAVHELTGLTTLIEDGDGRVSSRAGPDHGDPPLADTPRRRADLLRRADEAGRAIRVGERVIVLSRPDHELVRVLVLIDPEERAGAAEFVALEHAATVLAIELARVRRLDETGHRRQRDLVDALLDADADRVEMGVELAQALDYDLSRSRRVVVVDARSFTDRDRFFHAVRRVARDLSCGSFLAPRGTGVVVLADAEPSWAEFRSAVMASLGESCRVGVGGSCTSPGHYRRSWREAQLAVRLQPAFLGGDGAVRFDDLGVYQVLGATDDLGASERLVRQWLGALLDHDAQRGTHLVPTLHSYLERGGNYDATATMLAVHRSTLKARLGRIREVTGADLSDPDTRFNLQLACRAWRVRETLELDPADH